MAKPNYISYSDWEEQVLNRRKRRTVLACIVFILFGIATIGITARALVLRLQAQQGAYLKSLPQRINDDDDNPRSDLIRGTAEEEPRQGRPPHLMSGGLRKARL